MARPLKSGLDYFPLDVDIFSDDKVEYIAARFDEKGELIIIKLLCMIYRNGYYTDWSGDKALIFSKRAGKNITPSLANDVVYELVKRGFFDKNIFNSFAVLTSCGIQRRFLNAITARKEIEIISDFWVIDFPEDTKKISFLIKDRENSINHRENPDKQVGNYPNKSKVNKSKVNKNKGENNLLIPAEAGTEKNSRCKYNFSEEHLELAERLKNRILEHTPNFKSPSNLNQWANEIRLMVEQDKRTLTEIAVVIDWCQKDAFWQTNILSSQKLREKFDQLQAKMNFCPKTREFRNNPAANKSIDDFFTRRPDCEYSRFDAQAAENGGNIETLNISLS